MQRDQYNFSYSHKSVMLNSETWVGKKEEEEEMHDLDRLPR
jgi:hypothetical protein